MDKTGEKVLITGGSGFIGGNLLHFLRNKGGYEIRNIDIAEPPDKDDYPFWDRIDILDREAVAEYISHFKPVYIYHLAARTDLDGKEIQDYAANDQGTKNLIDAIADVASVRKVIFTSSMLVCQLGYIPKSIVDFNPSTLYGESKKRMEEIIRSSNIKCEWVIVRPTSIWGPGFKTPYRNFFDRILSRGYVHIGNRSGTCTYGYVGNTVEQYYALMKSDKTSNNEIYYLGDYEPYSIEKWANEIADEKGIVIPKIPFFICYCGALFGDFLKIMHISFPLTRFRLNNMTTNYTMNTENLKAIMPSLPYSRKQGVEETVLWMNNSH